MAEIRQCGEFGSSRIGESQAMEELIQERGKQSSQRDYFHLLPHKAEEGLNVMN